MKNIFLLICLVTLLGCTPASLYVAYEGDTRPLEQISILKFIPRSEFDTVVYKVDAESRWKNFQRAPVAHVLPGKHRIGVQTSDSSISIQKGTFPRTKIAVFDVDFAEGVTYEFRYDMDFSPTKDSLYWPSFIVDSRGQKIKPIKYLNMQMINYSDKSAE